MEKLKRLYDLLKQLVDARYFGTVIIKFQNGNIVNAVKEESIKFD